MKKRCFKAFALAAVAGTMLQFGLGGCFGPLALQVAAVVIANQIAGFIPTF